MVENIKLTALCHGGGCGCKISPEILSALLVHSPLSNLIPQNNTALMVGNDTADDAAVYRLNDEQALILTTDFFLPIVDDPRDFGRIAATNAISDVYAMGGRPILALAIVGMPVNQLPHDTIRVILSGGESVCHQAGIVIAGGHSIDVVEPFYGLVVAGIAPPEHIKTNRRAQVGDRLILCKPLGVGVYSAALRKDALTDADYQEMLALTTQLNSIGTWLGMQEGVHALTDVTGFGLPGHLLEICRASGLSATLHWQSLPWMHQAQDLAEKGYITGASDRNWQSYGAHITLPRALADWQRLLLCDPQTSGGLLASVALDFSDEMQRYAKEHGFIAVDVGEMIAHTEQGSSGIDVFA